MRTSLALLLLSLPMLFSHPAPVWGQAARQYSTKNKAALDFYNRALSAYREGYYNQALQLLERARQKDAKFVETWLLEGQVHEEARSYPACYAANMKAHAMDSSNFPLAQLYAARCAIKGHEYDLAEQELTRYLARRVVPPYRKLMAESMLERARFARYALQHPLPIELKPLPPTVNTQFDEYFPSLSGDGTIISFTRLTPSLSLTGAHTSHIDQEDLYIARRKEVSEPWDTAQRLPEPLNTTRNEGAQAITADGQRMYLTRCEGPCDIFYSDRKPNGQWFEPRPLPSPVNLPRVSDKQPSISPDGRTLYFASNRKGGKGGYDIWAADRTGDSTWASPRNLGPAINTAGDEQTPFIHFDGRTLYFSSDTHPGLGMGDLFLSRCDSTGWGKPRNLGYPINTKETEMGLVVAPDGVNAYYASRRDRERGLDIFTFVLPDTLRPTPVAYVEASTLDRESKRPLQAQSIVLDLLTGDTVARPLTSKEGTFTICLPVGARYGLFAYTPGYMDQSVHFDLYEPKGALKPQRVKVEMHRLRVGASITLSNVFFEVDQATLMPTSRHELDRLLSTMRRNPSMKIRIGGHTDNSGTASYNQNLSLQRATAVGEYLIRNGISAERIRSVGYGATKPAASNDTEEGRAANRRTECTITAL